MKYPKLFTPGQIGSLSLTNRVIKAPTCSGMANMDGSVSERQIRHYRNMAKGGTGLIIVEYSYIDDIASKSAHCQLGISTDEHIVGLAWLADTIKDQGARAGIQIEHCGRQKFLGTPPIKAASAVPLQALQALSGEAAIPEELTGAEIAQIVEAFGNSTLRAARAGFDLVEIHGAHGYLITNFLSPHSNKRIDQYGGSLENRMRLLKEIIANARSKVGRDFPLTVRLSGSDYNPGGFNVDETAEVAKMCELMGLDAIHVSGGDLDQMIHQVSPMSVPRMHHVWAAEAIKEAVKIPVIASGSITLPELAEQVLVEGKSDFISLARPILADPEWTNKAREGRQEDIRPCIRCNDGCIERTFIRAPRAVSCSVNPEIGREDDIQIMPAVQKKHIAVIGGGPAGMETARVAMLRGHKVTLFEKRKLGGALFEGSVADFKSDLGFYADYLARQMHKLGVRLISKEANVDDIDAQKFDAVVVATGGKSAVPNIAGLAGRGVIDAIDVFNGSAKADKRVVVLGGGETAVEVALYLNQLGHDVTLLHRRELMIKDCTMMDKISYSEMLASSKIKVVTHLQVTEVKDGVVTGTDKDGKVLRFEADSVVTGLGYVPIGDGLASKLRAKVRTGGPPVFEIGDCVHTAKVYEAVHAGYRTACKI